MQQVFKIIEDMGTYTTTQLYDKINELSTQKEALRQVLLSKGADVSTNVLLDDYPSIIDGICGHPDIKLEYIANGSDSDAENVKSVYFNTGFVPDASAIIEIKCSGVQISKKVNVPIISAANSNWQGFGVFLPMNNGKVTSRLGTSYVYCDTMISNMIYTIMTYVSGTTAHTRLNGKDYINNTTNTYGSVPAYLFAYNVNGTINTKVSYSGLKIYCVKMWNSNNILVKHFIPVLHYVNNQYVPCLYDKVNNNYIYNLGTQTPYYKIR